MYDRKAFKREAKELMRESTPHYMLVLLVYILLTTGLSYVVTALTDLGGLLGGTIGMFLNVLLALFSMVLSVGLAHYTLNLARRKPTAMGDLFEGFTFAGRSIGMSLLIALYYFLWAMLGAVVVAIIAGVAVLVADSLPALTVILIVIAYIALIVFLVAVTLRYAMAQFALAENPGDGASAAIRRSVQVMKGNKGKLFVLELSFLGWGLLCGLIVLAVLSIGVLVTGVDWFVTMFQSAAGDPMDTYALTMEMTSHLAIWTVVAEVVCLPLTLWLTAYRQTAYARFYNYVCGYDYHRYMNEGREEEHPDGALPESTPEDRPVPPGGFYTPAPKLDEEPAEEVPEEAEQTMDEAEELLATLDEEESLAEEDAAPEEEEPVEDE